VSRGFDLDPFLMPARDRIGEADARRPRPVAVRPRRRRPWLQVAVATVVAFVIATAVSRCSRLVAHHEDAGSGIALRSSRSLR